MTISIADAASALPRGASDAEASGPFPVLPGTMQRSELDSLLRSVKRALGVSRQALDLLMHMIDRTRPRDWTSPDREPVCYAAQFNMAAETDLDPRTVRHHEAKLAKAGLIERRTMANGARRKSGDHGIVFTPLIRRVEELIALRERLTAERREVEILVCRRSALAGAASRRLREFEEAMPGNHAVAELRAELDTLPRLASLRRRGIEALSEHLEAVRNLAHRVELIAETHPDISGEAEADVRPHLQETTKDSPELCSDHAHKPPSGGYFEKKHAEDPAAHNPQWVAHLDGRFLHRLASDEMRLYVDALAGGQRRPRMLDFTEAAIRRLPELGVNVSAWADAVETMGQELATVALLVIDANRDHPTSPVRSPGGLLRDLTRRHRRGKLSLVGALKGLAARRAL